MANKTLPIKHIGIMYAICDRRRNAHLRTDLGVERYKQLGVKERFKGEAPYRICPRCIAKLPTLYVEAQRFGRRKLRHGDGGGSHG